ncbi:MAG: DoxX family protein [Vicinamibacterales bacterium]
MNAVLWLFQIALALLCLAGGAYKVFTGDALADAMRALPAGGWRALGVLEMLAGVLLVVPAAIRWMPLLTPLAAAVLTLETLGLAAVYASYSLALSPANPLVWAVLMAVMSAAVAWGRFAPGRVA